MILSCKNKTELYASLDHIGLKERIYNDHSVLLKINLARPAAPGHPRTDAGLIADTIHYIYSNGGSCAIAESANGYLSKNLELAGLSDIIRQYKVEVIDLDYEEVDCLTINGEPHYLPRCLKEYGVRIAIPAASKRPEMVFSNNVKLFVGAVPRRMYQIDDKFVDWRPRIHIDLHRSVANLYCAIQSYSPFHFFINGGLAMAENIGEFRFDEILTGDDGLAMDFLVYEKYFKSLELPDYLQMLQAM